MKKGSAVRYIGVQHEAQITYMSHTDPRPLLTVGQWYKVYRVVVEAWHTDVFLVGIKGRFNSVWFENLSVRSAAQMSRIKERGPK